MRAPAAKARRQSICRSAAATASHSSGAGTIMRSAVALTAPTLATTSAASAASRHFVRVAAPTVRPTIQPRPAHGRSIAEVRET